MQIAVQQALDLIPIYGNAYAANLFSESGLIMNKYGDPVIEATHNEKIAKAFIGLRSKEHSQVTDFIVDLKGRELRSMSVESESKELAKVAKKLFDAAKDAALKSGNEADFLTLEKMTRRHRESLRLAYGASKFLVIDKAFRNLIANERDRNPDSKETLYQLLIKGFSTGVLTTGDPEFTKFKNLAGEEDLEILRRFERQTGIDTEERVDNSLGL